MQQKPDLILFTGDLVNNEAVEMDELASVFSTLNAPMGVFSILGNHDYGDYKQWGSAAKKATNLSNLKDVHRNMGWRLLLNEHVVLEKDNETIALIGVENWGGCFAGIVDFGVVCSKLLTSIHKSIYSNF